MPKTPKSPIERDVRRHNPLTEDYAPTQYKQKAPKRRRLSRNEDDEEKFVDSKASQRILRIGQELADEDEVSRRQLKEDTVGKAFTFESRFDDEQDDIEGEDYGDDEAWGDDEEVVEEIEVDPNDLDVFNRFNPSFDDPILRPGEDAPETGQSVNLADLILEKIAAREALHEDDGGPVREDEPPEEVEIPAKVVEVYSKYAGMPFCFLRQLLTIT